MNQEVVLITGINSGMGFATARALLQQGYAVIGTVRNSEKSRSELDALTQFADDRLTTYEMDLSSLVSVARCAEQMRVNHDQLDTLVFNAGIMTPPYSLTENGFESQFQVNYLGHYYLFSLLKDLLSTSQSKKVISISSLSSEKGTNTAIADFEQDIHCDAEQYDAMKCYRESKLAQVLFTTELHNRFSSDGFKSYAVHPGVVNTNLFYRQYNSMMKALMQTVARIGYLTGFLSTPEKGAATAIYLATHNVPDSGLYWADQKLRQHNPIANDPQFSADFWDWSAQIVQEAI